MQSLYVTADRLDDPDALKLGHPVPDVEGLLRCAHCRQLYAMKVPFRVRAEDVELHLQTLQSWIDQECPRRHPTHSFCTDGVNPCLAAIPIGQPAPLV